MKKLALITSLLVTLVAVTACSDTHEHPSNPNPPTRPAPHNPNQPPPPVDQR